MQRIHAPCIRVRGRAERSYFLYCPPKTREGHSEYTRRVFGCGDARREANFFTVHQKQEKIQRIHACSRARGTRGREANFFTVHAPFGCGDARREATFFTVHQKQEILMIQRIHAPCIRVRGRAERSYFLYCPPKTREETANTRSVYSGTGTRGE